jgi:hypothetical protein
MVALGVLSGVLSAFSFDPDNGLPYELWPGLWYGGFLGAYLAALRRVGIYRALVFVGLVTLSWYAAYQGTLLFDDAVEAGRVVDGLIGGVIGGSGMAATAALLFPDFRHYRLWGAIVTVGTLMGMLLVVGEPLSYTGLSLFCGWQAAVAAVLGHGLIQVRSGSARPSRADL